MRRYFVQVILVLALLLGTINQSFAQETSIDCAYAPGSGSGRVLVLLQGLDTSASSLSDQITKWTTITNTLDQYYSHFVYFSYDETDPFSYQPEDTYKGVWQHHVPLLHDTLAKCMGQLNPQKFDLIGHSMGGVTIFEYLKLYGLNSDQAGWIGLAITLDSPVNGSSTLATGNFAYVPWITESAFHSQSAQDMASLSNGKTLSENNEAMLTALLTAGIIFVPLTNKDDLFVPIEDGTFINPDGTYSDSLVFQLGNDPSDLLNPSHAGGHDQILYSRETSDMIAAWVDVMVQAEEYAAQMEAEQSAQEEFDRETEELQQTTPGNWATITDANRHGENQGHLSENGSITYLTRIRADDYLAGCIKSDSVTAEIVILDPNNHNVGTFVPEQSQMGTEYFTSFGIYAETDGIYQIILNHVSGDGNFILTVLINPLFACITN